MKSALLAGLLSVGAAAAPQVAFHQGLRWSMSIPRTTYRWKIPVGRAGDGVRVVLRAGSDGMTVHAVSISPAAANGATASPPVPLTFGGARSSTAGPGQRVSSELVALPVSAGEDLAVSVELEGSVASSAISAFPGSYARAGSFTDISGPLGGALDPTIKGVDSIEVDGPRQRVFMAIGDSITEGFVTYAGNDYRQSWPFVAQQAMGAPVVASAVYGQTIQDQVAALPVEVHPVRGMTDCVVLLGTNNLGPDSAATIINRLSDLYARLSGSCRVWGATLPPKEKSGSYDLATVNAARRQVNDWIRSRAPVTGVVDFDAALRSESSPDRFAAGLTADGVHPSIAGQAVMGQAAAMALGASLLRITSCTGGTGAASGGEMVTVSGSGFAEGATAVFGDATASISSRTSGALSVVTPAHAPGAATITVRNPDGFQASCPAPYLYAAPGADGGAAPAPAPRDPPSGPGAPASPGEQDTSAGCSVGGGALALAGVLVTLGVLAGRRSTAGGR